MRRCGSFVGLALLIACSARVAQKNPAVHLDLRSRADAPAAIDAGLAEMERYFHSKLHLLVPRSPPDGDLRLLSTIRTTSRYGTIPAEAIAGRKYFVVREIVVEGSSGKMWGDATGRGDFQHPFSDTIGVSVTMQKSASGEWSGEILSIEVS